MVGVEMLTESDEPIAARSRQAPEMIRIACVFFFIFSLLFIPGNRRAGLVTVRTP